MQLTKGQSAVLSAFKEFGQMTDIALENYVHHVADVAMSSSGIRTRRRELADKGLLKIVGTKKLKSGRRAAIYGLTYNGSRKANSKAFAASQAVV